MISLKKSHNLGVPGCLSWWRLCPLFRLGSAGTLTKILSYEISGFCSLVCKMGRMVTMTMTILEGISWVRHMLTCQWAPTHIVGLFYMLACEIRFKIMYKVWYLNMLPDTLPVNGSYTSDIWTCYLIVFSTVTFLMKSSTQDFIFGKWQCRL